LTIYRCRYRRFGPSAQDKLLPVEMCIAFVVSILLRT